MKHIFQIQKILKDIEPDIDKFYKKGNKTAGLRLRKAMQEIKILAILIRKEIQLKKYDY